MRGNSSQPFPLKLASQINVRDFKAESGEREFVIYGPASVTARDSEGQITTADGLKKALVGILKRGRFSKNHEDVITGEIVPVYMSEAGHMFKTDVKKPDAVDLQLFPYMKEFADQEHLWVVGKVYGDDPYMRSIRKDIEDHKLNSYSISGMAFNSEAQSQGILGDIAGYAVTLCEQGMNPYAKYTVIAKSENYVKEKYMGIARIDGVAIAKSWEVTDQLLAKVINSTGYEGDPNELRMGLEVEQEHNDIIQGDLNTLIKIVLVHLREDPNYYSKLSQVEKLEKGKVYVDSVADVPKGKTPTRGPKGGISYESGGGSGESTGTDNKTNDWKNLVSGDDFAEKQISSFINSGVAPEQALEIYVNSVEGDTTQLPEELADYAEKKGWLDGYDKAQKSKVEKMPEEDKKPEDTKAPTQPPAKEDGEDEKVEMKKALSSIAESITGLGASMEKMQKQIDALNKESVGEEGKAMPGGDKPENINDDSKVEGKGIAKMQKVEKGYTPDVATDAAGTPTGDDTYQIPTIGELIRKAQEIKTDLSGIDGAGGKGRYSSIRKQFQQLRKDLGEDDAIRKKNQRMISGFGGF